MRIKRIKRQGQIAKKRLCLSVFFVALFLFMLSGLASKVFTAQAVPFIDIAATDWYCSAVSRAKDAGILEGYPDGNFRPEGLVTYAEFLRMAIKDALPVVDGHWAAGYYDQGIERSLYTEYEIRKGSLDQPIPRKYMALVFAGLLPKNDAVPIAEFSDIDARSAFEYYIAKSAAGNLLIGYPDGTFRPEDFLTRAEAATAFVRLLDVLANYEGTEEVPVEDIEEQVEAPSIQDVMDPDYKAYLDQILESLLVSGSDGKYEYKFQIPNEIQGSKVYFKVAFYSPSGASALINEKFVSKDALPRIVQSTIDELNSLSQIGTASFNFSIASLGSENWHDYLVRWEPRNLISLRIQYFDQETNEILEEFSTSSLDYAFSWK